jgi:hypothetical protein
VRITSIGTEGSDTKGKAEAKPKARAKASAQAQED